LIKKNRDPDSLASWDVAADGWPPIATGDPIYVAILPPELLLVPGSSESNAVSMRNRHDPDEESPWVFVPGLTKGDVWLVHTKRVPTALN
jgi:hypothetical protein